MKLAILYGPNPIAHDLQVALEKPLPLKLLAVTRTLMIPMRLQKKNNWKMIRLLNWHQIRISTGFFQTRLYIF